MAKPDFDDIAMETPHLVGTHALEFHSNDLSSTYLGDCRTVLASIPNGSVDLVFADPPYNIGKQFGDFADSWPSEEAYASWCFEWLELCVQKLTPTGSMYFMTSTQAMPYIDIWLRKRLHILTRIVWHYDSSGVQAKKYFGSLYEPIVHCVKDPKSYVFNSQDIEIEARTGSVRKLIDYRGGKAKPYSSKKVPGNAWYFPRVRYRMPEYEEHPSQKPEALLERVILASSNVGDMVLDPFAGTFTTSAVAQRLQRRSIGIELNPDYYANGLRRLALATEFRGEALRKPFKSYQKNGEIGDASQPLLFAETQ